MGYMESDLMWYEHQCEVKEKELPVCSICGEVIWGDYAYILDEEIYCEDCWDEFSRDCRVFTESLMVS